MCVRNALILGFEEQERADIRGTFSGAGGILETTAPRKNSATTRGGASHLRFSTSATNVGFKVSVPRTATVGWVEFIIEAGIRFTQAPSGIVGFSCFGNQGNRLFSIGLDSSNGRISVYRSSNNDVNNATAVGGTQVALSPAGLVPADPSKYFFVSILCRFDTASAGHIDVRVNQKSVATFAASGLNINPTTPASTFIDEFLMAGSFITYADDVLVRPRSIRVDGATGGVPGVGNTITGGTSGATAVITGWESQSADSGSGPGDPRLAVNEVRLFLKNTSFDPDPNTADATFQNNEAINNTGLTGTILCNAPHAGFKAGLEPGSQFIGPGLFIERVTGVADGTDTANWSLQGGATNQADATNTVPVETVKSIQSTLAGDRASVTVGALPNQSSIAEVVGLAVRVHGVNDGVNPNAIIPRLIDNATDIDGETQVVATGSGPLRPMVVDTTAAGGQFVPGVGAGGTDSVQLGVESATV